MEVRVVRVRPVLALLVLCASVAGCGDKKSPSAPTPPATPTRIIALEGNMAFGNIEIGSSFAATLRIRNTGTETLQITGMTVPSGIGPVYSVDWRDGTIAAGASQAVTVRFTPTAAQSYTGNLTVNGNQTSGANTIQLSGTGVFPPRPNFSRSGVGDTVFDMPLDVARIHVVATYNGSSQNFVLRVGGRLLVNEIIGTCCGNVPRYEGTLLTGGGGVTEVRISSGVSWLIEEIR
jgi:hypothetical protein